METLCELNPELKTSNLRKGATLKIPNGQNVNDKSETENTDNVVVTKVDDLISNVDVVHKVLPKETLYRISKQYNVSVEELQKLNPGIENGLPVDYVLIIKKELIAQLK